jgi:hypothetical protein
MRTVRQATPRTASEAARTEVDFACAFAVPVAAGDNRSSEEWARAVWEGSPAPIRWFMLFGWRAVLRLRLGPRHSPDHILGWRIVERTESETVCHLESGFLKADNVFRKVDSTVVWSAFITYERPIAKAVWPPAALVHRVLARFALGRAATRGPEAENPV